MESHRGTMSPLSTALTTCKGETRGLTVMSGGYWREGGQKPCRLAFGRHSDKRFTQTRCQLSSTVPTNTLLLPESVNFSPTRVPASRPCCHIRGFTVISLPAVEFLNQEGGCCLCVHGRVKRTQKSAFFVPPVANHRDAEIQALRVEASSNLTQISDTLRHAQRHAREVDVRRVQEPHHHISPKLESIALEMSSVSRYTSCALYFSADHWRCKRKRCGSLLSHSGDLCGTSAIMASSCRGLLPASGSFPTMGADDVGAGSPQPRKGAHIQGSLHPRLWSWVCQTLRADPDSGCHGSAPPPLDNGGQSWQMLMSESSPLWLGYALRRFRSSRDVGPGADPRPPTMFGVLPADAFSSTLVGWGVGRKE